MDNPSKKDPGVFKNGKPFYRFIQWMITKLHVIFAKKSLPERVALFFHQIEERDYDSFREMIAYFKHEDYRVVGVEDYLSGEGKRLFLSFDDNHQMWHRALGFFDELDVKVTFYTNSGVFRDLARPEEIAAFFDRIGWYLERVTMSVDELRELRKAGHTIGAHTHSHRALQTLSEEEGMNEISRSQAMLSDLLNETIRHFSFPYGTPRFLPDHLREYCGKLGLTVADATPGMLFTEPTLNQIHRTMWRFDLSLKDNVRRVRVDGRRFVGKFRKSPIV